MITDTLLAFTQPLYTGDAVQGILTISNIISIHVVARKSNIYHKTSIMKLIAVHTCTWMKIAVHCDNFILLTPGKEITASLLVRDWLLLGSGG